MISFLFFGGVFFRDLIFHFFHFSILELILVDPSLGFNLGSLGILRGMVNPYLTGHKVSNCSPLARGSKKPPNERVQR